MLRQILLVLLMAVWVAIELGWGGSRGDWSNYRRPRDAIRPKWRWRPPRGPDPEDDDPPPQPRDRIRPKKPALVD